VPSANCRCRAEEQTAGYIIASCPLYHPLNGTLGLAALDDGTVDWLKSLKQLHTTSDDTIGPNKEGHLAFKIVIKKRKIKS